jgi:hypothetical protein
VLKRHTLKKGVSNIKISSLARKQAPIYISRFRIFKNFLYQSGVKSTVSWIFENQKLVTRMAKEGYKIRKIFG